MSSRTYVLWLIGLTTLSFGLGISSAAAAPRSAPVAARAAHEWAHRLPTPGVSGATARLLRIERQSLRRAELWKGIEASRRLVQPGRTSISGQHLLAGPPPTCDGRLATMVGTNGNDVIKGTPGRDVIVGLGGDDQISGLAQDDIICGGPGDDVIWGGAGNDLSYGGDGHDLIDAGPGNDTSDGGPGDRDGATFWDASAPISASLVTGAAAGAGSDSLTNMEELHGGNFNDTLTGDAGRNTLFGLDGNDVLNGGDGNDTLSGGEGNDVMDGGAGQNMVWFYAATGPISASLAAGTSGGQGNDTFANVESLSGGDYGDTLTGDGADNLLFGNGGNDTLSGGAGNDYLDGGAGDDTMDGGPGTFDSVNYYNAPGAITASVATHTATGDGADTFSDVELVSGSNYADTLSGGTADVWLNGNGANDTITGGSGNEFLFGGPGDDTISGGTGDDFLAPGAGTDTLDGGPGFDKAAYWDAPGPITASVETNTATGDGTDTYTSIEGIHGGNYDDTLTGSAANEEFFGNGGDDTIHAGGGNDNLNGWDGNDSLSGDAGDDYIDGWNGNDTIDGGDGNDALRGRDGNDTIIGGAGWDNAGYWDAAGPITANLGTGTATGEGTDSLSEIEQVDGSPFGDTFTGDAGNNGFNPFGGDDTVMAGGGDDWVQGGDGNDSVSGNDGNDYLTGGAGDDTIDGGAGWDTSAYLDAPGAVTASLAAGTAVGDGEDALTGIEQLDGSPFGDTFTGDADNNGFNPFGGDDTVLAGGGDDWASGGDGHDSLYGEAGNDYLDGGDGVDLLDGGPDWDTCVNGETTINCEA
jgi:Ca2+-binding RTX toxin-like protein